VSPELKWLDGYSGQSVDELIALASEYRIDSLVLAFEQALYQRTDRPELTDLNEAELAILAVESMEREVNNGGYHQFFLNTPEYAPFLVAALERIGCPNTAEISRAAIALIGLREPFTRSDVEAALARDPQGELVEKLIDQCDGRYYDSGESIENRLFAYIQAKRGSIRLR
jgi:hypothetical protein